MAGKAARLERLRFVPSLATRIAAPTVAMLTDRPRALESHYCSLAMIGLAGMTVQELVTGQTLFTQETVFSTGI